MNMMRKAGEEDINTRLGKRALTQGWGRGHRHKAGEECIDKAGEESIDTRLGKRA